MDPHSASKLSAAWALDSARQAATLREFHWHLLEALRSSVGCDSACVRPGARWPGSSADYLDADAHVTDLYVRDADRYRPGIARWCELSQGDAAFIDTEIFSTSQCQRIPLYTEVLTPSGVRSIMGCPLRHQGVVVALVLLFRRGIARPFTRDMARAVTAWLPGIALAELAMLRALSLAGEAQPSRDGRRRSAPLDALRSTVATGLPVRHARVLDLLLTGRSEKEVATTLSLSPRTVHKYTEQIFRTLHVRSRPELMALFIQR